MPSGSDFDFSHLSYEQKLMVLTQLEDEIAREHPGAEWALSPEQVAELDRRSAEVRAGTARTYTWSEVKASLEQKIRDVSSNR